MKLQKRIEELDSKFRQYMAFKDSNRLYEEVFSSFITLAFTTRPSMMTILTRESKIPFSKKRHNKGYINLYNWGELDSGLYIMNEGKKFSFFLVDPLEEEKKNLLYVKGKFKYIGNNQAQYFSEDKQFMQFTDPITFINYFNKDNNIPMIIQEKSNL